MQNRGFKLQAEEVMNRYLVAEKGEKRTKKSENRAMNRRRRMLEKRETEKLLKIDLKGVL